jgi:hypothetical protein
MNKWYCPFCYGTDNLPLGKNRCECAEDADFLPNYPLYTPEQLKELADPECGICDGDGVADCEECRGNGWILYFPRGTPTPPFKEINETRLQEK